MKKNMEQNAFTLAEVLITLAIIGVVAALTIPTLITNYQKQQYVTQLKKNYSVLQNGIKTYIAKQGMTRLSDTNIVNSINGDDTSLNSAEQSAFAGEFSKIFAVSKSVANQGGCNGDDSSCPFKGPCDFNDSNSCNAFNTEYPSFILKDGTSVNVNMVKSPVCIGQCAIKKLPGMMAEIRIDVNGRKGPNIMGRDAFYFVLFDDGSLHGMGSKRMSEYLCEGSIDDCSGYWRNNNGCTPSGDGNNCAAKIMEEGWEMKY